MKHLLRAFVALSLLAAGAAAHADVVSFYIDKANDCGRYYQTEERGFSSCVITAEDSDEETAMSEVSTRNNVAVDCRNDSWVPTHCSQHAPSDSRSTR